MEQNRPLRDRAELRDVLTVVLDRVGADFDYRLVGTAAALAQGVDLPTCDVDILVARREDVDRFAAALSTYRCLRPPVWLPEARQYFGNFAVAGIEVGASTVEVPVDSDTFECVGRGPWEHFVDVSFGRHAVPVVRLELRLVSELVRDRPNRYGPLIGHLRAHGADEALVQRSMRERGVDPVLAERVLDQLRSGVPASPAGGHD